MPARPGLRTAVGSLLWSFFQCAPGFRWRPRIGIGCVGRGQAVHQDDSASGEEFARGRRRSWARLIKKVYEADPLVCPPCSGPLKIISLIGDARVIEKILRHLKLWDRPERPPPLPAVPSIHYDEPTVDPDEADQWPDATA